MSKFINKSSTHNQKEKKLKQNLCIIRLFLERNITSVYAESSYSGPSAMQLFIKEDKETWKSLDQEIPQN